jgi:hypothetical protein
MTKSARWQQVSGCAWVPKFDLEIAVDLGVRLYDEGHLTEPAPPSGSEREIG